MNINRINKKLKKQFGGRVTARLHNGCIYLTGELASWSDVISACGTAAKRYSRVHVVNDITFTGAQIPPARLPRINDESLQGDSPDVLVIGGGISGASIERELTKWNIDVLLVDKEPDLAMQASGRNDGEVHPGVDLSRGSLKHHYVLRGNRMYQRVCEELDVPFKRCGQYVGFTQGFGLPLIWLYALKKRFIDGVSDTRIVTVKKLKRAEPELNVDFKYALYNPSAGCVCPYGLTIAYAENAVSNGARVSLNTAVTGMEVSDSAVKAVYTNRGTLHPALVINAAGVFAEEIARMANDRFFSIHPRRGTNSILDKQAGHLVRTIASVRRLSVSRTNTKGGGLLNTVHGNILAGPDAVETYLRECTATSAQSIQVVFDKQQNTAPALKKADIITYFTGTRAPTFEEDFIIERGRNTSNIIHCAGIQSPGLTTAPAVAADIERLAVELLSKTRTLEPNPHYNPIRRGVPVVRDMAPAQRDALIRKNPDYGVIVCRCEEISRGEIIDALDSPVCVPTIDGVKKRVRPGMGRCQGGFCSPLVAQIISEHLNIPLEQVKKSYDGAYIVCGAVK